MECIEAGEGILDGNQLKRLYKKIIMIFELIQPYSSLQDRCALLYNLPDVIAYLHDFSFVQNYLKDVSIDVQYVLLSLIVLDEKKFVFSGSEHLENQDVLLQKLVRTLLDVEDFYKSLGGLFGYYLKVLELMGGGAPNHIAGDIPHYLPPPMVDMREELPAIDKLILSGITHFDSMAEVYVVGGAGDRLDLVDEESGEHLPAARLPFLGKTLLQGLIEDLEGREYLYYKLFKKQLVTPIVLMTSDEKNNDVHIARILQNAHYFGRPQESFFRCVQPLIPVITTDGYFAVKGPLELFLKPGGHGVIWKLSNDSGALQWLLMQQRKALLVRQINNPLAGLDYALLAHCGYGIDHDMAFGFAACERLPGAQEGVNVLRKKEAATCITNVEYMELHQARHQHLTEGDFPANMNILYANIREIMSAVPLLPLPGMLVNMKLVVETIREGKEVRMHGARLESTMQNIAEAFDAAHCFVTLNRREKIMSVTKKSYHKSGSFADTPESAFYDLICANARLLKQYCALQVPQDRSPQEYLQYGPSMIFLYHPALGPLYRIIAEKIQKGKLHQGAELQLHIAEAYIENLELTGSLIITADRITGVIDAETGLRRLSNQIGQIELMNVTVANAGILHTEKSCYWKNQIERQEGCQIRLEGHSRFVAHNVRIEGDFDIIVPDGMSAEAIMGTNGKIEIRLTPIGIS